MAPFFFSHGRFSFFYAPLLRSQGLPGDIRHLGFGDFTAGKTLGTRINPRWRADDSGRFNVFSAKKDTLFIRARLGLVLVCSFVAMAKDKKEKRNKKGKENTQKKSGKSGNKMKIGYISSNADCGIQTEYKIQTETKVVP